MRFSIVRRFATVMSLLAAIGILSPVQAAEHIVKMLNTGTEGSMVFEPAFIAIELGDTVVFIPAEIGAHNSASLLTPEGAEPWRSAADTEFVMTLDKEGVYLYACDPHKIMGMVGVIQVGNATNLEAAKARAAEEQAAFALGKGRFDKALAKVK